MNRHIFVAVLSGLLCALLFASETSAHGFAGKRLFPATIWTDGPFLPDRPSAPNGTGYGSSPKVLLVADSATAPDADTRKQLFGDSDNANELLPPDQAFAVSISVKDANTLVAKFTPANGYYLYRDNFVFRVHAPTDIQVASVVLPRGETKDDPSFGKTEVFHRPVQAVVRLNRANSAASTLTLYIKFQGCNEPLGVCYVPIEKTLRVTLPASAPGG